MKALLLQPVVLFTIVCLATGLIVWFFTRYFWSIKLQGVYTELQFHQNRNKERQNDTEQLQLSLEKERQRSLDNERDIASLEASKLNLVEKLENQALELDQLHEKLYEKFENIANQILDRKTEKFTAVNEQKIKALIEPLGKEIKAFTEKVNEEGRQRFSLAEQVKLLSERSDNMSQVAINLTQALKGDSKAQGGWGEMILESLLEKSGLRKGEQYFMEHQLTDSDGKALRSENQDKKMRPDAVINYPDERSVIVDSKVSLTAFSRYLEASDDSERKHNLDLHLASIKGHIRALSEKGYDDYRNSMDFILMFVPSEPAYIAAMQADPELWSYAYDRRILLQSPTNLITSLKLIEELWKRENHNQNAQRIAERGAKLYDKFVGFVENLEQVGTHLDKAKSKYEDSYRQLSSGTGNLVRQADQLKQMVGKTKKEMNQHMVEMANEG